MTSCWFSLLQNNFPAAQKAVRAVARRLRSSSGTPSLAYLAAKLATRGGSFSKEVRKDLATLKASIGARPLYPNEPLSIAALLLTTRDTDCEESLKDFVTAQLPRLMSDRGVVWPFITRLLRNSND